MNKKLIVRLSALVVATLLSGCMAGSGIVYDNAEESLSVEAMHRSPQVSLRITQEAT